MDGSALWPCRGWSVAAWSAGEVPLGPYPTLWSVLCYILVIDRAGHSTPFPVYYPPATEADVSSDFYTLWHLPFRQKKRHKRRRIP